MASRVRVFLDTSALFAGIWSAAGGAGMLLRLGEVGAVSLLVSAQVLAEAEGTLRGKAPESLGLLALLLDRSGIETVAEPPAELVSKCGSLLGHPGDAQILAAAWATGANYLATLDQAHFLSNPSLGSVVPFPIGTPGDFLAWFRDRLTRSE